MKPAQKLKAIIYETSQKIWSYHQNIYKWYSADHKIKNLNSTVNFQSASPYQKSHIKIQAMTARRSLSHVLTLSYSKMCGTVRMEVKFITFQHEKQVSILVLFLLYEKRLIVSCLLYEPLKTQNQLMKFHSIWYEHHATTGHLTFVPFNFLSSIIPIWQPHITSSYCLLIQCP